MPRTNLAKMAESIIEEHELMKRCPYCGGTNTRFLSQSLTMELKDILTYICLDCKKDYTGEFSTYLKKKWGKFLKRKRK